MREKLKKLLEKRARLVSEMRQAIDGSNGLSPEEREKMGRVQSDLKALDTEITDVRGLIAAEEEQRAAEAEQAEFEARNRAGGNRLTPPMDPDRSGMDDPEDQHEYETPSERRARMLGADYRRDFNRWICEARSGQSVPRLEHRDFSADALVIGTDSAGGYLAPDEYQARLTTVAGEMSVMRQIATIVQTSRGKAQFPKMAKLDVASTTQTAEKGTFGQGVTTFSLLEIEPYKMTVEVPLSDEMLNDSMFDIQAVITQAIGEDIAYKAETWYVTGSGTSQPQGVTVGAGAGKTAASATAVTADELKELLFSLKRPYRNAPKSGWLMNDDTFLTIALLKDGNQQYYIQPNVRAADDFVLYGKTIYTSDAMPDLGASKKPIAFGDFSKFIIVDRQTRFQLDPYTKSSEGVVLLKAFVRTGSAVLLDEAIKVLVNAAA